MSVASGRAEEDGDWENRRQERRQLSVGHKSKRTGNPATLKSVAIAKELVDAPLTDPSASCHCRRQRRSRLGGRRLGHQMQIDRVGALC
jgi:hypothetical protein